MGSKSTLNPNYFNCMDKKTPICQNIYFVSTVESHTGLEWREGEEIMTEFVFVGQLPL